MEDVQKRISRVENFFSMLLTGKGISDNVFVGELPATVDKEWTNIVLVDVNRQTDYDSHGFGSASIFLYARPTGKYLKKNVKELDRMEDELNAVIKECQDSDYVLSFNWRDSGYDTNRNFHYNVVNVNVLTR